MAGENPTWKMAESQNDIATQITDNLKGFDSIDLTRIVFHIKKFLDVKTGRKLIKKLWTIYNKAKVEQKNEQPPQIKAKRKGEHANQLHPETNQIIEEPAEAMDEIMEHPDDETGFIFPTVKANNKTSGKRTLLTTITHNQVPVTNKPKNQNPFH